MSIPSSKEWLADTNLTHKPRSAPLKALDAAIAAYEKSKNNNNLYKIKHALEDWKRFKGPAWAQSERNRSPKKPITSLDAELSRLADYRTYQITHMDIRKLQALAFVARHRKQVLTEVFKNKKVSLKGANLVKEISTSLQKTKDSAQQASGQLAAKTLPPSKRASAEELKKKMLDMALGFFGVESLEAIGTLSGLILKILHECSVSVAPVVGHIKNGYEVFTEWAKAGKALYTQCSIADRSYSIDTGAPSEAFAAVHSCLKEETKNQMLSASRATASFALKTGLVFADGGAISGPVVGAANALAQFCHKLYLLGTEWRSTKAINQALESGQLDIRLFKTYPLMGCYLMVSATLSDLIPIESFGTPGWMDYIENMKKHAFDDIYKAAVGLIDSSPWEIMGLPKRPMKTSAGVLGEAKRVFGTVSPLGDLAKLRDLDS